MPEHMSRMPDNVQNLQANSRVLKILLEVGGFGPVRMPPEFRKPLFCQGVLEMAPEAGLEPATLRLTAACSTIELLWNSKSREGYRIGHGSVKRFRRMHQPR